MGLTLYPPVTAPEVYDIVWCKWPRREDKLAPGSWVRCVLVVDVRRMVDERNGQEFALVTAQYGTGKSNLELHEMVNNVVIEHHECRRLGLHKPTVFQMDLRSRKRLPWCVEYFVPQEYLVEQNIIAGHLNGDQQVRFLACFQARNLRFPLP
jgi:hypothetical protein